MKTNNKIVIAKGDDFFEQDNSLLAVMTIGHALLRCDTLVFDTECRIPKKGSIKVRFIQTDVEEKTGYLVLAVDGKKLTWAAQLEDGDVFSTKKGDRLDFKAITKLCKEQPHILETLFS